MEVVGPQPGFGSPIIRNRLPVDIGNDVVGIGAGMVKEINKRQTLGGQTSRSRFDLASRLC